MSSGVVAIVLDLLRYDDPRVRRNAITALGMVGDDESVELMVRTALEDPDPMIRKRAEEELVSLQAGAPAFNSACRIVSAQLKAAGFAPAAYALLGRLTTTNLSSSSLRERLWWSATYRPKSNRRLGRVVGLGSLSSIAVGLFVASALWLAGGTAAATPMYGVVFATAMFIAPILGLVSAIVSYPYGLYPDRGPAAVVAIVRSTFFPALLFGGAMGIALLPPADDRRIVQLLATAIVATAVTRFGTLTAYGIFPGAVLNGFTQAVVGTAAGIAVVMTGYGLIRPLEPAYPVSVHDTWMILIGSMACLATAAAVLDSRVPPRQRETTRSRVAISAVMIVLALLPFGLVTLFTLRTLAPLPVLTLGPGQKTIGVLGLPFERTIRLSTGGMLTIVAEERHDEGLDCMVTLYSSAGRSLQSGDDPPSIRLAVEHGDYRIVYTDFESKALGETKDREVKWFVSKALAVLPAGARVFLGAPRLTLQMTLQPQSSPVYRQEGRGPVAQMEGRASAPAN